MFISSLNLKTSTFPYCSLYISSASTKENLFKDQELLYLVIISFILVTIMWCDRGETVEVEPVSDYTCLHAFKVRYQLTSQNKPVTERKLKQEILLEQVMIIIHQQHNEIALKYVISFPFLEKKRKRQKNFSGCGKSISRRYLCSQMWKHFVIQPLIL